MSLDHPHAQPRPATRHGTVPFFLLLHFPGAYPS